MGFQGSRYRVWLGGWGSGFRDRVRFGVQGSRYWVQRGVWGSGFKVKYVSTVNYLECVQGLEFRVWCSGFGTYGRI